MMGARPGKPARRSASGKAKPLPTDAAAALRVIQALNLILAGHSYEDAARQTGYASRSSCWTAVHRELKRRIAPPADDLLQLELARLDRYLAICDKKAEKGDLWAIDRCLKIGERRHRLLGLEYGPKTPAGDVTQQQMVIIGIPPEVLEAI